MPDDPMTSTGPRPCPFCGGTDVETWDGGGPTTITAGWPGVAAAWGAVRWPGAEHRPSRRGTCGRGRGRSMVADLPDPRPDGLCCTCRKAMAETRDGRFCRKCLKAFVARLNPIPYRPWRGADKQEASHDPGPWQENAVRAMEGDR